MITRRVFSVETLAIPFFSMVRFAAATDTARSTGERYLFVWAGDQARRAADFLAVVDFDVLSASYGKVLAVTRVPGPGASGNEPHHVGLSRDGRILACGGLLSVLKGQKEIFFFDVSDPLRPRFISSADPPLSSITDEFYPLANGGFLVTMMGGANGAHPGRVAEFSRDLTLIAEHPSEPPSGGFNPHGISVRPELNLMITSDFICPSSTLHAVAGDPMLGGSLRVWDFKRRAIRKTIQMPRASGFIDVQLIPRDRAARAYTAGMADDQLYLVETGAGTAKSVFDFSTIVKGGWPQLIRLTGDGRRLFISLNKGGKVVMLDISRPEKPRLMSALDLGPNSGPHYLALTTDEKRLVVTDYFLNEDDMGKVHEEGDHQVHVARINDDGVSLDPTFRLDFNTAFRSGPARPHGVAFK
jgi:selenium-binding protein 1